MQFIVSLLLTSAAFQAPTPARTVQIADGLIPTSSPRVIAAANPNLTNEERGDIMMARKMYLEAVDFYLIDASKSAILSNKLGIAYHQLGQIDKAKKAYEKATKLDKTYAEAFNNLGAVHYAKKSYRNAIKQYEKAVKLAPNMASAWSNLGTAYFARKKYEEAFQFYAQALYLDPQIFERRGSNGVQLLERSVEEKAKYYYMLAKTYAQAGIAERALQYIRFALENQFKEREKFTKDPEFAFLQENAEFQALLAAEYPVL